MYTFTKLHDRRIPKVRVGVGPMEFSFIDELLPTALAREVMHRLRLSVCPSVCRFVSTLPFEPSDL